MCEHFSRIYFENRIIAHSEVAEEQNKGVKSAPNSFDHNSFMKSPGKAWRFLKRSKEWGREPKGEGDLG